MPTNKDTPHEVSKKVYLDTVYSNCKVKYIYTVFMSCAIKVGPRLSDGVTVPRFLYNSSSCYTVKDKLKWNKFMGI